MEDNNEQFRENAVKAGEETIANIVYTVVFDTCNEMITAGVDQDMALQCANSVVNRYLDGGIKVRKKPAPRAPKGTTKSKNIDAMTAASRKQLMNMGEKCTWVYHPNNNEYSYTTGIRLESGYPVRENATRKICYVINDTETRDLSNNDVRMAKSFGLTPADQYTS